MGNGTKIGLVVLLILGVVLAAKFLDSGGEKGNAKRSGSKEEQAREAAREAKRYRQPGAATTPSPLHPEQRSGANEAGSLAGTSGTISPYVDGRDGTFARPRVQDPVAGSGEAPAIGSTLLDLPNPASSGDVRPSTSPGMNSGHVTPTSLTQDGTPLAVSYDTRIPNSPAAASSQISGTPNEDSRGTGAGTLGPPPSGTGLTLGGGAQPGMRPGDSPLDARRDIAGQPKQHKVEAGDSLWKIAKKYYGNGAYFEELRKANPSLGSGNELQVGDTITIPVIQAATPLPAASSGEPALAGGKLVEKAGQRVYTIADGDSLYAIAARLLSDGNRWSEIKAANPGLDPDRLKIGKQINIPAK